MKILLSILLVILSRGAYSQNVQCTKGGIGSIVTVNINGVLHKREGVFDSKFSKIAEICNEKNIVPEPSKKEPSNGWFEGVGFGGEAFRRNLQRAEDERSKLTISYASVSNTPEDASDVEALFDIQYPEVGTNGCDSISYCGGSGECAPKTCEPNYSLDQNGYCVKDVVPCPSGEIRIDGICRPENEEPTCGANETLVSGQCVPNEEDETCPEGQVHNGLQCVAENSIEKYRFDLVYHQAPYMSGSRQGFIVYPIADEQVPGFSQSGLQCEIVARNVTPGGEVIYPPYYTDDRSFHHLYGGCGGPVLFNYDASWVGHYNVGVRVTKRNDGLFGPIKWIDHIFEFNGSQNIINPPSPNPLTGKAIGLTWDNILIIWTYPDGQPSPLYPN